MRVTNYLLKSVQEMKGKCKHCTYDNYIKKKNYENRWQLLATVLLLLALGMTPEVNILIVKLAASL